MQRNGSCADVWFVVALLALAGCGAEVVNANETVGFMN